ncbi:MAG TPA: FAD-binding oxidoreductase [Steroidobacteraceae bacterium]|nr:FAD-binding oxidoreductase [Steroidobacteraceae bacterium]
MPPRTVLPAGVSNVVFERALAELRRVVGADSVLRGSEPLLPYEKLMIPAAEEQYEPSAAVLAASLSEVQGVLAVCNKYKVPIWPISTGRNFGFGSAAPATAGQVILDLKRMDRILEVDPVLCTALVEPGVTYQQLHDYLKERKIDLWLDFPADGPLVGPVGNTLERGVGRTPYADHLAHTCGMEVVLADGRVLRTGMGSLATLPKGASWQAYKYGYGPYLDGLFTQSNFGVVTKLGLWLMPAPPSYRTVLVQYGQDEDLARAVETVRPLRLSGTITNPCTLANATLRLTEFTRRGDLFQGTGAVPDGLILTVAREHGIAPWNLTFSLYGTPEQIAPNLEIVTRVFEASGGRVVLDYRDGVQSNELSLRAFGLLEWVGGGGLIWLPTVSAARGADAVKQRDLARGILAQYGLDYLAAATVYGRDLHHLAAVVFDHRDPQARLRVRDCFRELISAFTQNGYGIYRASIDFMDAVARTYGGTHRQVNHALKRALDPNGILAPGKSGIHEDRV